MAYPSPSPDSNGDSGEGRYRGLTTTTPRWVKVFGTVALVLVLLVVIMVLAGGASHGPGRHTPSDGAGGHAPPSKGHENTTGVGGPTGVGEMARTVEIITVDSMTFEPDRVSVSAGETVTFVMTNTGQAVHEFSLGDAAMQKEHAREMAQIGERIAHHKPNIIMLQPGEIKQITWRFGDTGTLEYACHRPSHYQAGMRGQITIT